MSPPIKIDPRQICILDASDFAELCSDLITFEALRVGIPGANVHTNLRILAPDGGIDCRIDGVGDPSALVQRGWLPDQESVWQFKSGPCPSAAELRKGEFSKPGVVRAMTSGLPYLFISGDLHTDSKRSEIESVLDDLYRARGHERSSARVIDANMLANWASEYLSVAAKYILVPLGHWQLFRQWASLPQFQNPFVYDAQRQEIEGRLHAAIDRGDKFVAVEGSAGVGKTRLVLVSVSRPTDQDRVLYLVDADQLEYDLQQYFQLYPGGSAILVIDEVAPVKFEQVRNFSESLPPGVSTIAVCPIEGRPRPGSFHLGQLGTEELSKIVGHFAPQLSLDARGAIAARCSGSPKLVEVISRRVSSAGSGTPISWEEIERDPDVQAFVGRLFPVDGSDTSIVLRGASLFTKLGWQQDVQAEARAVWAFFKIDQLKANLAVGNLIERHGVISKRGRYIYVTPEILANQLARETFAHIGAGLKDLLLKLPSKSLEALVGRLAQLGGQEDALEVVRSLLEQDGGFFASLEELNDPGKAKFFRMLASAFPSYALDRLEQLLNGKTKTELTNLREGRREVVWALEELAWHKEYFHRTARLVLLLAIAETESYVNNATGVWKTLFQVVLSGTEVDYRTRAEVLDQVLSDPDPDVRELGLQALSASLNTFNIARFGSAPISGSTLPPNEWHPATYKDWSDILRENLERLARPLDDPVPRVRESAMKVFVEHARDLVRARCGDRWLEIARNYLAAPYDIRKPLHDAVFQILAFEADSIGDLRAAALEVLAALGGNSDEDRIRGIVGSWPYETSQVEGIQGASQEQILDLANQASEDPGRFLPYLDWLAGPEAHSSFAFGVQLGLLDKNDRWKGPILQRWIDGMQDDRFAVGYFKGVKDRVGDVALESELDEWAKEPRLRMLVALVSWRCLETRRSARRLAGLIRGGDVSPTFIGNLAYGYWARDLPMDSVAELLDAAESRRDTNTAPSELAFLAQYLETHPTEIHAFQERAFRVLETCVGLKLDVMGEHFWGQMASRLLELNPERATVLAVDTIKHQPKEDYSTRDDAIRLLGMGIGRGGWDMFERYVAPALLEEPKLRLRLGGMFSDPLWFPSGEPDRAIAWVECYRESRLGIILRLTPVHGIPLPELTRRILVRWGDNGAVRSALAARFMSGIWSGSAVARLERLREEAAVWHNEPERNVRDWAEEILEQIEIDMHRERVREEEESLH